MFFQSFGVYVQPAAVGTLLTIERDTQPNLAEVATGLPVRFVVGEIAGIPNSVGEASSVLADTGYVNIEAFERLEAEGKELYVAVSRNDNHSQRRYDYRPKSVTERPSKVVKDPRLLAMQEKLESDKGRALYASAPSLLDLRV